MFTIRSVDLIDALACLGDGMPASGIEKILWDKWSQDGTLFALVAEQAGDPVGLAIAESHPNVVHVVKLSGTTAPCRLLLDRLLRLAGERDVSVWCPLVRTDLRKLIETRGFISLYEDDFEGRPSRLYCWKQNEDVEKWA